MSVTKEQIEERLKAAHEESGLADVRESYRDRLRALRAADEDTFRKATDHYEKEIVPRILDGTNAIDGWIAYGARICELTGSGRLLGIDGSGRSQAYQPPYTPGTLVLWVSAETGGDVLPAAVPAAMTPAQEATVALLVDRELALPS